MKAPLFHKWQTQCCTIWRVLFWTRYWKNIIWTIILQWIWNGSNPLFTFTVCQQMCSQRRCSDYSITSEQGLTDILFQSDAWKYFPAELIWCSLIRINHIHHKPVFLQQKGRVYWHPLSYFFQMSKKLSLCQIVFKTQWVIIWPKLKRAINTQGKINDSQDIFNDFYKRSSINYVKFWHKNLEFLCL